MNSPGLVYLIPSLLDEESSHVIPAYIVDAVKQCQVFFVENERTARRFLKKIWKEMIIDNYEWHIIPKMNGEDGTGEKNQVVDLFRQRIKEGKTIGILSEAGCPGVADPGQALVAIAHEMNAQVRPLVGPSSLLLALMASGMNGQRFQFLGYLPIDNVARTRAIRELENESQRNACTQLFIETPYRNNQLFAALINTCKPNTRLCLAVDLTGKQEWISTRTIAEWKKEKPAIHKRPAIFLLSAGT
jgi:16S rRNA (cytidine1402-2'-O)-methyltransferase